MTKTIPLVLTLPFLLSGCIGSQIWGNTAYVEEDFPDIRLVPEREIASAPRGLHPGDEKIIREGQLKQLEQEREQIKARDQALREKAFDSES